MARRKRKKTQKQIELSAKKVWIVLFTISIFYFFIRFFAYNSPLIYLTFLLDNLFGTIGTHVLFGYIWIAWIMLIKQPKIVNNRIFWKFFFLFIITTALISLQLLDQETTVTWKDISSTWWRTGYAIMKIIYFLIWDIVHTKFVTVAIFTVLLVIVLNTLRIKEVIPKISITAPEIEKKQIKSSMLNNKSKETTVNTEKKNDKKIILEQDNNNQNTIEEKKKNLKNMIMWRIAQKQKEQKQKKVIKHISFPNDKPTFSTSIMDKIPENLSVIDENILSQKAQNIQNKLMEFNIPVEVAWQSIWPTVVQFKIKPQSGIKVSQIERLKKDLTLSLKSKSLRILAPIPGTSNVGIEIPNPNAQTVYLRELLESNELKIGMNKDFTNLCIWKTIEWNIFIKPLKSMPHLLVAGATGSGKSVAINDFIISLLYQNSPNELKFIMVDPKQVELGLYEWIPHLLCPIINDPEKALKALQRSVDKMNERYKMLKMNKVRNIEEYNKKVDEKMNRIVIIIDELADLMMSWKKKEVELNIARIAQMARAVWMHLIIATQRPSVNVITWLIKANIPTRIAFWVVSQVDSRTILDRSGAEDLLGRWDLLFVNPENKYPIRIQAPFVSTQDTEKIIHQIKLKYMEWLTEDDIYDSELVWILEKVSSSVWWVKSSWTGEVWDDDQLIQQAIEVIKDTQKASITLLQRRLKIWFARAARLMDELEERWVVWPQEWSKPRDILI